MSIEVTNPYKQITDKTGKPLDNGLIYIGEDGRNPEVYPIQIFYDEEFTLPAPQPIRTINGYFSRNGSPAKIFTKETKFSIIIRDKFKILQFSDLYASGVISGGGLNAAITSAESVADLIATKNLKTGQIVETAGYYNTLDNGGATYLISATATDYSIPLNNGLHAVFNDDFDIRKFGIRDSVTLNQTTELTRMVAYADSRVYEIDFHNFKLMTPETYHYTTGRGAILKGMGFRNPHHLKNLTIANDKTKQLFSGTCPIIFFPDNPDGAGVFKLENVKLDPYVADFKLASGEMDGYLCGFRAGWHVEAPNSVQGNLNVSGYSLDFEGVEFLSPAISYNLACAGLFTKNLKARNVTGDYWGAYLVHHTYNLDAKGVHGIFRDDLHTGSGRLLVTNLIHEEAEIGELGVITRNNIIVKSASCFKKTGAKHVVYKCHRIGNITINNFEAEDYVGGIEFYTGATAAELPRLIVKEITLRNSDFTDLGLRCTAVTVNIENIKESNKIIIVGNKITNLNLSNVDRIDSLGITYGECTNLTIKNCGEVIGGNYGLIRSDAKVQNIFIDGLTCEQQLLIECKFQNLNIKRLTRDSETTVGNYIRLISDVAFENPVVNISHSSIEIVKADWTNLFLTDNTNAKLNISKSYLSDTNVGTSVTPTYKEVRTNAYKPIEAFQVPIAGLVTTVTAKGFKVGDAVRAVYSTYNANIEIYAVVSAQNTVTVKFKNTSAAVIDLPSGPLAVKLG